MFRRFAVVAESYSIPPYRHASTIGGFVLAIFIGLHLYGKLGGPSSVLVTLFALLSAAFIPLTNYLNSIYEKLPPSAFKTPIYKLTWPHWVVLLCMVPLLVLSYSVLLFEDYNKYMRPRLVIDEAWHVADLPIYIMVRDAWSIVDIGTNSDGSAEAELVGTMGTSYALIFRHGPGKAMNDHLDFRRSQILDDQGADQCDENRKFESSTIFRRIVLTCEGTDLGDPVTWIVTIVEDEDNFYELVGYAQAPLELFPKAVAALKTLSVGFHHNRLLGI